MTTEVSLDLVMGFRTKYMTTEVRFDLV